MIRITIELVPYGIEENKRPLGMILIANDGSGTLSDGNYNWVMSKKGTKVAVWKRGDLKHFPRKRLSVYDLLYRILRQAVGERNDPK